MIIYIKNVQDMGMGTGIATETDSDTDIDMDTDTGRKHSRTLYLDNFESIKLYKLLKNLILSAGASF
jgi:hypothetical protein